MKVKLEQIWLTRNYQLMTVHKTVTVDTPNTWWELIVDCGAFEFDWDTMAEEFDLPKMWRRHLPIIVTVTQ